MRYLLLGMLSVSLYGQATPPPGKGSTESFFGIQKFFPSNRDPKPVFPFGRIDAPSQSVASKPGPCAIPLTNVLPLAEPVPIRRMHIPDTKFPMTEVIAPAPSCNDSRINWGSPWTTR